MNKISGALQRLWLNLPLRGKGLIVTTIPVVALLGFSAAFFVVQQEYKKASRWLRSGLEVFASLQRVRTGLLEEDIAVRGYGLTGEAEYLKAYRTAVARRDESLQQLHSQFSGRPERLTRWTALRKHVMERQAAAESFIKDVAASAPGPPPSSAQWLAKSKIVMGRIDAEFAAMVQIDRQVLIYETQALAHALKVSNAAVLASIVVGLIGGIVAMLLFASGIVRRIARLQKNAADLAEGSMPAMSEFARDEIGRLGLGIHETAKLLGRRTADLENRAQQLAQTEVSNQKQARLLQCILDSMGEGVVVSDQTGSLVLCNPAAQALFGGAMLQSNPENWLEQTSIYLSDGVTPCPLEEIPLVRAIRGENPQAVRLLVRNKKSEEGVWIDITARPLREETDVIRGGVAVFRDMSAAKKAEETLRLARADAERANHAKSEFLSRMSHELRTPLNSILGFAQLLDLDPLSPPQRQSVDQILKGGRHLLSLINEVLDLARIEAGKLALSTEPIVVGEAIQAAIDLVSPLARQNRVAIRLEESPDWKRYILADRQRFQQVVLNLLSNAIKYNRLGGRVSISCLVPDESRFQLAIHDTGEGLPPEKMARLFQPFERLGAEQSGVEGTGIGLALSKRLVTAMGGIVRVESLVGIGSTFCVELPICEGPLHAYDLLHDETNGDVRVSQESSCKKITLLYVEDNLSNTLLMERILENRPDVRLISAMQGRLGLELAREHDPDLIFLDLHLPDMTGDEVLRALRRQPATSGVPIAMISADATPTQIERLLAAGANEYFTKPLDVRRLLQYVDEVLGVGV